MSNQTNDTPETTEEDRAFVAVAPLYDLLMHGVPYEDWMTYLHRLLAQRNASPRHILDLACGTGNMAEPLTRQGYAVTGVDIAPHMIAEAKRKAEANALKIDYFVQDAAELDLPGRRFDLCISLFDSLNYITDPARLQQAMHQVAAHLTRNGLFIFDMNTEFALKNRFFDQDNLGSDAALLYDWDSTYDAQTRLCKVWMRFWHLQEDGTRRAFEETHVQYAYRNEEIVAMLEAADFTDIAILQAYTLRPPTRASDRVFFVGRKG